MKNLRSKNEIIDDSIKLLESMNISFLEHTYNIIKIMATADTMSESDKKAQDVSDFTH